MSRVSVRTNGGWVLVFVLWTLAINWALYLLAQAIPYEKVWYPQGNVAEVLSEEPVEAGTNVLLSYKEFCNDDQKTVATRWLVLDRPGEPGVEAGGVRLNDLRFNASGLECYKPSTAPVFIPLEVPTGTYQIEQELTYTHRFLWFTVVERVPSISEPFRVTGSKFDGRNNGS